MLPPYEFPAEGMFSNLYLIRIRHFQVCVYRWKLELLEIEAEDRGIRRIHGFH